MSGGTDNTNFRVEPSPISPFTYDSPAWRILSGTIKSVYNTREEAWQSPEEARKTIEMAPMSTTGVSPPPYPLTPGHGHEALLEPHAEHLSVPLHPLRGEDEQQPAHDQRVHGGSMCGVADRRRASRSSNRCGGSPISSSTSTRATYDIFAAYSSVNAAKSPF